MMTPIETLEFRAKKQRLESAEHHILLCESIIYKLFNFVHDACPELTDTEKDVIQDIQKDMLR